MHEAALARGVLEAVLARTPAHHRIRVVHGRLAETEALGQASLAMHFEGMARGTAAEGARLELELVHVAAKCRACGAEYLPEHHLTLCPTCGSTDGELLGETGLRIDSVEVERGPPQP